MQSSPPSPPRAAKPSPSRATSRKQADITRLFAETKKTFGRLDILVNNAGVYAFAPLDQITEELFHAQFNLNVLGLLLTTKEAAKYFGAEGGSIINISSAVTTLYPPGSATYTATKASVDAITIILSKELGPKNIRVNAINPGLIETEGVQSAGFHRQLTSKRASPRRPRSAASASPTTSHPPPSTSPHPTRSTSPGRRSISPAASAKPSMGAEALRPAPIDSYSQRILVSRSSCTMKFPGITHCASHRTSQPPAERRTAIASTASTRVNECRIECGVPPVKIICFMPSAVSCSST